jgi:hypothetical protein
MEQTLAGGSPLHGADARGRLAIAWSGRSREARSGLLLIEHSEVIVRLLVVIIGKTTGSFLGYFSRFVCEGPGLKAVP